jgi:hypothetical protein
VSTVAEEEWRMRESQVEGGPSIEPLGLSIKKTAEITGESPWQVKEKLRNGTYKAKKSGRRTIVIYQTVKAAWASLPDATFKPSKRRHAKREELTL